MIFVVNSTGTDIRLTSVGTTGRVQQFVFHVKNYFHLSTYVALIYFCQNRNRKLNQELNVLAAFIWLGLYCRSGIGKYRYPALFLIYWYMQVQGLYLLRRHALCFI
jgi:hypothetical protein